MYVTTKPNGNLHYLTPLPPLLILYFVCYLKKKHAAKRTTAHYMVV